jgi:hypothetical protein
MKPFPSSPQPLKPLPIPDGAAVWHIVMGRRVLQIIARRDGEITSRILPAIEGGA